MGGRSTQVLVHTYRPVCACVWRRRGGALPYGYDYLRVQILEIVLLVGTHFSEFSKLKFHLFENVNICG